MCKDVQKKTWCKKTKITKKPQQSSVKFVKRVLKSLSLSLCVCVCVCECRLVSFISRLNDLLLHIVLQMHHFFDVSRLTVCFLFKSWCHSNSSPHSSSIVILDNMRTKEKKKSSSSQYIRRSFNKYVEFCQRSRQYKVLFIAAPFSRKSKWWFLSFPRGLSVWLLRLELFLYLRVREFPLQGLITAWSGKPMFSSFVKSVLTKTFFSKFHMVCT